MGKKIDYQALYELLATIPYGRVITYGDLAAMLGNRTWARSVGNALHCNPDGDRYPCYKVVNSQGRLSHGYVFGGIAAQRKRLEAEGIVVKDNKVDLRIYGYKR